jgi:hypothetical protein
VSRFGWEQWEHDVQELLGLDPTPASGARWQAVGDAVDTNHPTETFFPLMADCKYTVNRSYSITHKLWSSWQDTAAEAGKRFILPVRIDPGGGAPDDLVVMDINDFAELLELARRAHG